MMKILVLGGYGNFGARICRALAGDAGIELLVAGRDERRATAFAESLGGGARGIGSESFGQLAVTIGFCLQKHGIVPSGECPCGFSWGVRTPSLRRQ